MTIHIAHWVAVARIAAVRETLLQKSIYISREKNHADVIAAPWWLTNKKKLMQYGLIPYIRDLRMVAMWFNENACRYNKSSFGCVLCIVCFYHMGANSLMCVFISTMRQQRVERFVASVANHKPASMTIYFLHIRHVLTIVCIMLGLAAPNTSCMTSVQMDRDWSNAI